MKENLIIDQTADAAQQLDALTDTHRKAIKLLISYKSFNGRLAYAISCNDTARADKIRKEIAAIREQYSRLTAKELLHEIFKPATI